MGAVNTSFSQLVDPFLAAIRRFVLLRAQAVGSLQASASRRAESPNSCRGEAVEIVEVSLTVVNPATRWADQIEKQNLNNSVLTS